MGNSPQIKKSELKSLIRAAANGDPSAAAELIEPFLAEDEELISCGITGKSGIIPTYDFGFLTQYRIGDLEVTPFTGHLSVEIGYISKVVSFHLRQPSIPLIFRLVQLATYLFIPVVFFMLGLLIFQTGLALSTGIAIPLSLFLGLYAVLLTTAILNPLLKRVFLRLTKSGLLLMMHGHSRGLFIFSDRERFHSLVSLSQRLSDLKNQEEPMRSYAKNGGSK